MQVALAKIPERVSPKPVPIRLPHPLHGSGKDDEEEHAVCLIVKEDDKAKVKKALAVMKMEGVSEVVGLQELRTDYKEFQERRKLRDGEWSSGYFGLGGFYFERFCLFFRLYSGARTFTFVSIYVQFPPSNQFFFSQKFPAVPADDQYMHHTEPSLGADCGHLLLHKSPIYLTEGPLLYLHPPLPLYLPPSLLHSLIALPPSFSPPPNSL